MTGTDRTRYGLSPGIIFDLDGTLADTLDDITDSLNELLAEGQGTPASADDVRNWIGEGVAVLIRRAAGPADDERVGALVERFRGIYARRLLNRSRLFPGIGSMLTALCALECPMCVLSNKPDAHVRPICDRLLAGHPIVHAMGHVSGISHKPDPSAALSLARKMRRPACEVIVVGDTRVDVETGRNAGTRTIAVTWGYGTHDELIDAGPDCIVDEPRQVVERVRDWISAD